MRLFDDIANKKHHEIPLDWGHAVGVGVHSFAIGAIGLGGTMGGYAALIAEAINFFVLSKIIPPAVQTTKPRSTVLADEKVLAEKEKIFEKKVSEKELEISKKVSEMNELEREIFYDAIDKEIKSEAKKPSKIPKVSFVGHLVSDFLNILRERAVFRKNTPGMELVEALSKHYKDGLNHVVEAQILWEKLKADKLDEIDEKSYDNAIASQVLHLKDAKAAFEISLRESDKHLEDSIPRQEKIKAECKKLEDKYKEAEIDYTKAKAKYAKNKDKDIMVALDEKYKEMKNKQNKLNEYLDATKTEGRVLDAIIIYSTEISSNLVDNIAALTVSLDNIHAGTPIKGDNYDIAVAAMKDKLTHTKAELKRAKVDGETIVDAEKRIEERALDDAEIRRLNGLETFELTIEDLDEGEDLNAEDLVDESENITKTKKAKILDDDISLSN